MSWETVKLGSILTITTGKYDVNHSVEDGAYPFFTCAMLPFRSNTFSFDDEVILLPGNGANVGEVMYFNGKLEAYQRTYVLHKIKADVRFVYFFLKAFWKRTQSNQQYGSATNYIRLDNITDLQIPLPPLPIQKRIAEILDAADALKRKDQALLKKYDELAQAIFIDMFGDPVKNEKGWEVKKLGDIFCSFKYGTNQKSNDNSVGIPVLRIPNVIGNEIDLSNLKYSALEIKEIESTKLEIGDLLFVRSNGNPNYIGRSALFLNDGKYSYASYLIRARLKSPNVTLANFIQNVLSYKTYRPIILKKATTTAGNYNINTESLKSLSIPIPKQELVDCFFEKMKLINALNKSINTNKSNDNLFNSLIQKAFNGELVAE